MKPASACVQPGHFLASKCTDDQVSDNEDEEWLLARLRDADLRRERRELQLAVKRLERERAEPLHRLTRRQSARQLQQQ